MRAPVLLRRAGLRASLAAGALFGQPITAHGRTMDGRMSALVRFVRKLPPGGVGAGIEALRTQYADAVAVSQVPPPPGVRVEDVAVPLADGTMTGQAHTPTRAGSPGTVLYFHGGGFIMGSPQSHAGLCSRLAHGTGWRVVASPYRLAPEHPFPAAHDDAEAALQWVRATYPGPVAVAGDSAGASLAAWLANTKDVLAQCLLYPVVDMDPPPGAHPSMQQFASGYLLTAEGLEQCKRMALPSGTNLRDPRLSPAQGVPGRPAPALVTVAGFDPLRDQGIGYVAALQAAGQPMATMVEETGLVHGFADFAGVVPAARGAVDRMAEGFRALLGQAMGAPR